MAESPNSYSLHHGCGLHVLPDGTSGMDSLALCLRSSPSQNQVSIFFLSTPLRRRFFPCSLPPKHIQITTAPPRQTSKSNTKCTVFNRIRQALDEQQKALDSLAKGEYIDAAWGNLDDVSELIMSRNALYRGENLS